MEERPGIGGKFRSPSTDGRKTAERYLALSRAAGDGTFELDDDGHFVACSGGMIDVTGYARDDLVGEHVSTILEGDDRARLEDEIGDLLEAGERVASVEVGLRTASGSRRPCELRVSPLDADGSSRAVVGVVRIRTGADRRPTVRPHDDVAADNDVTQLKAQARRLERQRNDLRTELDEVLERVTDGFYALDDRWRFVYVNERAAEFLGKRKEELLGTHVWTVFPNEERRARYERAMETQEPITYEEYSDTAGAWFEVRVYPSDTGLSVYFRDVTDRKEREDELERKREQLEAIDELNGVVREITDSIVDQSTREKVERTVCESLAASDSYAFAWVGEVDSATGSIRAKVEAGVEDHLDGITLSTDPDDPAGRGPAGQAVRTREMQISRNVLSDPSFEPWHEHAREYGYRSAAAIPITHEGTLYGVLGVYTKRSDGFADDERAVVAGLGEIVGHALAAVERKRALTSDVVTEIEFRVRAVFEAVGASFAADEPITIDRSVPVGDGTFFEYGTTSPEGIAALEAGVEQIPYWNRIDAVGEEADRIRFELELTEPPVPSVVASHGGYIEEATIDDGDVYVTAHLQQGVDVRRVTEAIKDEFHHVEPLTRRQVSRETEPLERIWSDRLTDRQRAALEVAYCAGFFEWPRDSTGEAIADSLDVSPATFHQHLRVAQKRLFGTLFEE